MEVNYFEIWLIGVMFYFESVETPVCNVLIKIDNKRI